MAYKKTEWVEYETLVSAGNLNKIENQLEGITSTVEINEVAIQLTDTKVKVVEKTLQTMAETIASTKEEIDTQISGDLDRFKKQNDKKNKEIAYLKLKQDASDRIEGGTTFADDMNGTNFGIEFDAKASVNVRVENGSLTLNKTSQVVNDLQTSLVANNNVQVTGAHSRRLVMLDDGTLMGLVTNDTAWYLRKSVDGGKTWNTFSHASGGTLQDASLVSDGTYCYMISCEDNTSVKVMVCNANQNLDTYTLTTAMATMGECALVLNDEGTELHAVWTAKAKSGQSYSKSFNIYYAKGTLNNGTIMWGSSERRTGTDTAGYDYLYPSIVLNAESLPVIPCVYKNGTNYAIQSLVNKSDSSWTTYTIKTSDAYEVIGLSSCFVPRSINNKTYGYIWVAWAGKDSTSTTGNIVKATFSSNSGQSWSTPSKIKIGSEVVDVYQPSITATAENEVYIIFQAITNASKLVLKQAKRYSSGIWSSTVETIAQDDSKYLQKPSTLYDSRYKTSFEKPLMLYQDGSGSVYFYGKWTSKGYEPQTSATAAYKLPSTDYIGLFVKKEGNVTITATVNDSPMNWELEGDEYLFTKELDSEAPVTLKLSLSRKNTTNGDNDKVTRILGGRS